MSTTSAATGPAAAIAALGRVDVLIVNYNAGDWLQRCIQALRPDGALEPRVIIVDNGSTDGSLGPLSSLDPASATLDRAGANLGFAAGINRAAAHSTREFLLLLNPDCLIEPAALTRLVEELDANPDTALVSGKVTGLDGREQRASRRKLPTSSRIIGELLPFSSNGIDLSTTPAPESAANVEAVSGACMLVRADAFDAVGGLDEGFPMHFEDLDLFARLAQAGHATRWVPEATIVHAGGQSSRSRPVAVLWARHRGLWRYLRRHCCRGIHAWQLPLWFIALAAHAIAMTPVAWLAARRSSSSETDR